MKHLKMQYEKVKEWWKPGTGTVSMLDLTMARLQVKLSTGLISILSPVERAMSRIQLGASGIQSRAKETIALHRIQKIKPVEFKWQQGSGVGVIAQPVGYVGYQTAQFMPNNNIQFNSAKNSVVLTITSDGDVIWNGKPSEAADILVRSFQMKVEDIKGVTKAAKRRYYMLACQNLLKKAEDMEYEEFLAFLNREVYNRERKVILDALKGNEHAR